MPAHQGLSACCVSGPPLQSGAYLRKRQYACSELLTFPTGGGGLRWRWSRRRNPSRETLHSPFTRANQSADSQGVGCGGAESARDALATPCMGEPLGSVSRGMLTRSEMEQKRTHSPSQKQGNPEQRFRCSELLIARYPPASLIGPLVAFIERCGGDRIFAADGSRHRCGGRAQKSPAQYPDTPSPPGLLPDSTA